VKAPKVLFADAAVAAHLQDITEERLVTDRGVVGALLENFVAMELRKQAAWSRERVQLFHMRTHGGQEVGLVLENGRGHLVGIEVKASANVQFQDFKGLDAMATWVGDRFRRGVVLYTGTQALPFGDRYHALPLSALWHLGAQAVVS
jgi:predicted AAA+ superfamily ATPase